MKLFTIPNIITLANLLCGILGLIALNEGQIQYASILILVALILDFLDGFVARLTNSYSEIGKQLDSLADMVSFGVLPSLILFYLLKDMGNWQYASFLPAMASALRLAKFNIDERQSDSFRGLPTPANAMVVASFPFMLNQDWAQANGLLISYILMAYAALISIIMISDLPMFALKFKSFNLNLNKLRYSFLAASLLLLLFFQFTGIPMVLILYIGISIFTKKS
jgi:CDP-diacylglycerol---serine O-phosphatidyltransferase